MHFSLSHNDYENGMERSTGIFFVKNHILYLIFEQLNWLIRLWKPLRYSVSEVYDIRLEAFHGDLHIEFGWTVEKLIE